MLMLREKSIVRKALPARGLEAKALAIRGVIVLQENTSEAALVEGIKVIPVERLSKVVEFLGGRKEIPQSMSIS